jgi:L-fuculokinase
MAKKEVIAVLDVGKTNKKVSVFDRDLQALAVERTSVEPKDYRGIEVEDTDTILRWFREALKNLAKDHDVRAVTVTAHGATFVLLDESGGLAHPVISYTWPGGSVIQDEFYATFGDVKELHRQTGTPDIGFVNMAKVLFFVKTRLPEVWARVRHGLFYGPYFGYTLTGRRGVEPTFPGNHTYFWDYHRGHWSDVAKAMGADELFGQTLGRPWDDIGPVTPEVARECGLPGDCRVALGIHDSNANFLTYLAKGYDDFLLDSTGTWSVMMRPADSAELTDEEIEAKVFFNQDAFARPVRTSLMTSGMDYDAFRALSDLKDEGDIEAARRVVAERRLFVVPGVLSEATAFPGQPPRVIDGDKVYPLEELKREGGKPLTRLGQDFLAALNLGMAIATKRMLGHCRIGSKTTVFIEGGFAKNRTWCETLAALNPGLTFMLTGVAEGTSFGAALTGWMLADGLSLEKVGQRFELETTAVKPSDFGDIAKYEAEFLRRVQGNAV